MEDEMSTADLEVRDDRGEWQPRELPQPGGIFRRPLRPGPVLSYFFGKEGLLYSINALYLALAVLSWLFLTPSMARMSTLSIDWILLIFARNTGFLVVIAGGLHLRLYIKQAQGKRYKYSDKWLATKDKRFLFGHQTRDNVFFSIVSGCTIWTAYEVFTLWGYANGWWPMLRWRERPVAFILLLFGVLIFRHVHFYLIHRLIHFKPLYRISHYLHHKNVNIGPWSGLSMHPIEHLLYFSGVLIHFIVPSHPVHAIFHLMHAGLAPASGHSGYHAYEVGGAKTLEVGDYFHYLHHRYFTVNYGNTGFPVDKWFGSYHDGTLEAHEAMLKRRSKLRKGREE
jgi:sterol desaturase/sphingolipid hydroxylase (fatty acid hydroxylase superfamily)